MSKYWLPLSEFFPPTPRAYQLLSKFAWTLPSFTLLQWLGIEASMGRTSGSHSLCLPGRFAWSLAEAAGPVNLLFIFLTLPLKLQPTPSSTTSFLGTGLPAQCEVMGMLYVLHYINRAVIAPLFLAPSMSPIHVAIAMAMMMFQILNSSNIASWVIYSTTTKTPGSTALVSPLSVLGLLLFGAGLCGNIASDNKMFALRRGAAKRKAKSEGKAVVTYDKVYVVPPPEGLHKYILFPHYVCEWLEWTGYWILGGAWGFGWGVESAALWFVVFEVSTMLPRAVQGKHWYEKKFGKRPVAGRAAAIPFLGL